MFVNEIQTNEKITQHYTCSITWSSDVKNQRQVISWSRAGYKSIDINNHEERTP